MPVRENDVGQVVVGKGNKDVARGTTTEVLLPPGEVFRRSVYVQVRRSQPLAVLEAFDAAATEPNCEARTPSTVTPQALLLMNSDFIREQAAAFAGRLRREAGAASRAQVVRAWRLAFAAEPDAAELREALAFLAGQTERSSAERALVDFCQALLSANRFLYVD